MTPPMPAAPIPLAHASKAVAEANRHLAEKHPDEAVRILAETFAAAPWTGEAVNVLTHNLIGALRQVTERQIAAGEHEAARATTARALAVPPPQQAPPQMLRHRAELFHGLGLALFSAGMVADALPCQRRALALYPCPSFSNNLVNSLALLRQPSILTDYCDTLELTDLAPHLLIACQPKSGSTFLKNVLCQVTGFRDLFLFHASGQSEQDLFYPVLLEFATVPTVTQQHCRAAEANLQILQAFDMKTVVLVRNLADVVVSLRDFYSQGAILGTFFSHDAWRQFGAEDQADLIIDHIVPWHLQFLASWQQADNEARVPVLWLTYEELMCDRHGNIRRVLEFYNLPAPEGKISAALAALPGEKRRNRFNRGVSGRGREGLTATQHARIRQLASHFPDTDFTVFGLTV